MSFATNFNAHAAAVYVRPHCICDFCYEGRGEYSFRRYDSSFSFDKFWSLIRNDEDLDKFELCMSAYNFVQQGTDCFCRFDVNKITSDFDSSLLYLKEFLTLEYGSDAPNLLLKLLFAHTFCPYDVSTTYQSIKTLSASVLLPIGVAYIYESLGSLQMPPDMVTAVVEDNVANFRNYLINYRFREEHVAPASCDCAGYLDINCDLPELSDMVVSENQSSNVVLSKFSDLLLQADNVPSSMFDLLLDNLESDDICVDDLVEVYKLCPDIVDKLRRRNLPLDYMDGSSSDVNRDRRMVNGYPVNPPCDYIHDILSMKERFDFRDDFPQIYAYGISYVKRPGISSFFDNIPSYLVRSLKVFDDLVWTVGSPFPTIDTVKLIVHDPIGLEVLVSTYMEGYRDLNFHLYLPEGYCLEHGDEHIQVYYYPPDGYVDFEVVDRFVCLDPDSKLHPDLKFDLLDYYSGLTYASNLDVCPWHTPYSLDDYIGLDMLKIYSFVHYKKYNPLVGVTGMDHVFSVFQDYYRFARGDYIPKTELSGCLICVGVDLARGHVTCTSCNKSYFVDSSYQHQEKESFPCKNSCLTIWSAAGQINDESPYFCWAVYFNKTSHSPFAYSIGKVDL